MSTYTPASFPRRPKLPSLAGEVRYQAQLMYYRYEINTGLYVMSPGEKLAFNLINLFIAALMFSAIYYCTPTALTAPIRRLACSLGGNIGSKNAPRVQTYEAIMHTRFAGDAVASLAQSGHALNASMAVSASYRGVASSLNSSALAALRILRDSCCDQQQHVKVDSHHQC